MHFVELSDKEVPFKNLISNFTIPFDIKNDIVYCQKSFRIYLKVHQMVITRYGERIPTLPKIKKLMADLEREIYQINAEQKFLIIRFRRCLEEFYDSINKRINVDRDLGTTYINLLFSNAIDNLINDSTLLPIKVKKRRSLEQWMLKFGLNYHDNEKQGSSLLLITNPHTLAASSPLAIPSLEFQQRIEHSESIQSGKQHFTIQSNDSEPLKWSSNIPDSLMLKQVSLLKPKSERSIGNEIDNERNDNQIEISNIKTESSNESNNEEIIKVENEQISEQRTIPKVSMSINTGRMNLLQALNKAKSQNQQIMSAVSLPTPIITNQKNKLIKFKKMPLIVTGSKRSKDDYQHCKPSTSKTKSKSADNSVPQSSASSDDSLDGIKNYPLLEKELPEPTEYNQEMFLRLFGLNTLEHSVYLQQRRSKRRRRNVQSNNRKDFHYGNLEVSQNMGTEKEKKKKIFLASPTANRNIKRKQIEKKYKSKERFLLSPEEKILCNQCSKNGDIGLSRCETCRGYFHTKCHKGAFLKKPLHIREKICPTCYKAQKSRSTSTDDQSRNSNNTSPNEQISLLKELHGKLTTAHSRKNSLIKESEIFKTKMNELFTIVDTIKKEDSDNDNETINKEEIELDSITDQLKCQEILMDDLKCDEIITDDEIEKESSNKIYSEEQKKFDQIMMLIHDNSDMKKNSSTDDYDLKSDNLYEIYDSENNDDYDDNNDDVIMIIDESGGEGNDSIYEIQENSHDGTDIEMLEE